MKESLKKSCITGLAAFDVSVMVKIMKSLAISTSNPYLFSVKKSSTGCRMSVFVSIFTAGVLCDFYSSRDSLTDCRQKQLHCVKYKRGVLHSVLHHDVLQKPSVSSAV